MIRPPMTLSVIAGFLLTQLAGAAPIQVTTVVLPKKAPAEIHIKRPGGKDSACLTFDLKGLPESAQEGEGLKVDLRLVGFRSPGQRFPQIVQVFKGCNLPPSAPPIGGWRVRGESAAEAMVESSVADEIGNNKLGLARAVKEAMGGELQLLIRAVDDETDWKYASLETSYGLENGKLETYNFDDEKFRSSTRPRLILHHRAPAARAIPPWRFGLIRSPIIEEIATFTNIVSGPLLYEGDLILIDKTSENSADLIALRPYRTIAWKCSIQGRIKGSDVTIASQIREHSLIDGQGRLYNFGARAVTVYDLKSGCPIGGFPSSQIANPSGVVPQGQPIASPGGHLYLVAEGQENYLYALSAKTLGELWRSDQRIGTQVEQIVLSGATVYALGSEILRWDAATGKALDPLEGWTADRDWKPFRPLVSPGPEADTVVLAATGLSDGLLTAFSGEEQVWIPRKGPLAAEPTLAKDATGTAVLTIQNQRFLRLRLENGREICSSQPEPRLACAQDKLSKCTSNLVVDAAGTAYFLNNGVFYGYDKKCRMAFGPLAVNQQNDLLLTEGGKLVTHNDQMVLTLLNNRMRIAVGGARTCAILYDGSLKCWGDNGSGMLGQGDSEDRGDQPDEMGEALKPVDLGSGGKATEVTLSYDHSCAILEDGSVKCWGYSGGVAFGVGERWGDRRGDEPNEMGDGLEPVNLGSGRRAALIAARSHTCVILTDGLLKCWGENDKGQLGQGDSQSRGLVGQALQPVDLGSGRIATQVAVGTWHTCALLDNGSVKCWGGNAKGQLGQGDTQDRGDQPNEIGDALKPVDLGSARTATQIAAGNWHTCALLDDGTVKCWGQGDGYQLGQGDLENRGDQPDEMGDALQPVDLGNGRTATQIAAGHAHSCAILDDDALKCWGFNFWGELGRGDSWDILAEYPGDKEPRGDPASELGDALAPVNLGSGRFATQMGTGVSGHMCAILDDGSIKCWGANYRGELGQGDKEENRGDQPGEMGDALPAIDLGRGAKAPPDGSPRL